MPPKAAAPDAWLPPLPGIERDSEHTYWLGDFRFPVSVTGVLAAGKSAAAHQRLEASRPQWAPRGVAVHQALELASSGGAWCPDLHPASWPYLDWIEPLLNHAIWNGVEVIAAEYPLYLLDHHGGPSIAGCFDLAWQLPGTISPLHGGAERTLVDLKTQSSPGSSPYDTRPQLGGYLALAAHHGLVFDRAATLWARPGRCQLVTHSVAECLASWEQALARYRTADPPEPAAGDSS